MKLMGIAVGLFALLMFVGTSYAAKAPKGDVVAGKITAITAPTAEKPGSITIKTKADEVTLATTKDTTVTVDGAASTLDKLEAGMNVKASPATGTATKIDAMTKKPKAK